MLRRRKAPPRREWFRVRRGLVQVAGKLREEYGADAASPPGRPSPDGSWLFALSPAEAWARSMRWKTPCFGAIR